MRHAFATAAAVTIIAVVTAALSGSFILPASRALQAVL